MTPNGPEVYNQRVILPSMDVWLVTDFLVGCAAVDGLWVCEIERGLDGEFTRCTF